MGWATLAFAGLSAVSSIMDMDNAKKNAKAQVAEGNIASNNEAIKVRQAAARQESSFLSSGLTLDGTPLDVLNNTYDTGQTDVNQIISNYNNQSRNTIATARSQAIKSLAQGASMGSMAAGVGSVANVGDDYFAMQTGGQGLFDGGFTNMVNANKGFYGPGF